MKAETQAYLAKARECLGDARQVTALPRLAAREAYYAAFHAAEAYIFEHIGKIASTHRGVRSEFTRLSRHEPRIPPDMARFLGSGYQFKATADYGVGPTASVAADDAIAAIDTAERFIDTIAVLLTP